MCAACSLTCCAGFAGLTSLCARRCRAEETAPHLATHDECGWERAFPVLLWLLGREAAKTPRDAALQLLSLLCSRCCVGHVPHAWSAGTSRLRHACTDRDQSPWLVEPCACDRRIKRSSRSAHGCLREPHRGSLSLSLVPSRSSGTCSILGLRDLGLLLDDRLGSASSICIPGHNLLSIHSTIDGILMHLMQVRHRFTIFCGASRRCARASTAVCSQEEIISTSTCPRSTTALVTNSSRTRLLRHSQCLISYIMPT